jgi:RNA polymerase sigma-70 factor (ECF subfamily)
VRAVDQLDTSRDRGQIAAWLYRVAHNAIADHWRAFYRLPLVGTDHVAPGWEPADPSPIPSAEGADAQAATQDRANDRVRSLLERLPESYRRVLELRFLQRLSVAETARAMGITDGNARVLQYRALRRAALLGEGTDG